MSLFRNTATAIRSSLKLKLVLIIVFILSVTIGIAPWSAIRIQERQFLRGSEERLRSLHAMLRSTIVTTCMLSGDAQSIQALIETVAERADIHAVRLFDPAGVVRFSSDPAERGTRISSTELTHYYGQVYPELHLDAAHVMTHTLVQPILNESACFSCHAPQQKVLGVLQVNLAVDQMWDRLGALKRFAVLATLLTLGAIAWSIWMALTYFVDQPLQQLVQAMGRVEEGELGTRVHSRSTDELGRLTRHFNKMISKQESAQRDIERLHKEQMARADRLATIGAMAAAIAHEIRNPLTGIRGALSVLSRGLPDEDPRRLIVRETNLVIDRLNKSVEDILDYARPSLPQLQTIELGEVVDRTLSLLEGESREAGIELVKESVAGGGREDDKATVNVDPQQIQQVLVNLILNAMHATRAGGRIFIRTRPVTEGGRPNGACIEVEDHGEGMTSEAVEKAFQPFFTTKAKGTGLGLAIARQIVEQHHGRISLRSVRGEGTCVEVTLPALFPSPSERT